MARESVQKKLQRVRPPRVQITYDVEIGDAIQLKELPFVLGVLGDFTGMPAEQLARLTIEEREAAWGAFMRAINQAEEEKTARVQSGKTKVRRNSGGTKD